MKLTNTLSQNFSLQLSTSLALDRGLEEVYGMVKSHENNLADKGFLKEMKAFLLASNKKSLFRKGLPKGYFLRDDPALLDRALVFAEHRHRGEYRESGYPYLAHVLGTGFLLARLGFPREVILAGILHDTVEDAPDKNKILNELHAIAPAIAWHVYSVSAPDIKDAIEKDRVLYAKIREASIAGDRFPEAIKCADSISNLYDLEYMKPRDGRSSQKRQQLFLEKTRKIILPFARTIDETGIIPLKKGKERFSLLEFIEDTLENKNATEE